MTNKQTPFSDDAVSKRIPELDGVRGLAILLVVFWHYLGVPFPPPYHGVLAPLFVVLGLSWSGVDLFFVLSGYLIGGILLDNRGSANYFRTFYLRRACRILPLYYLVVLAFLIATWVKIDPSWTNVRSSAADPLPLWSYLTLTQNIVMTVQTNFGCRWLAMTWSLAVEEQFYLFIPLLLRLVTGKRLMSALLVLVVLAPCLRAALIFFERPEALAAGYVMMPCRADALLLGVIGACLVRSPAALAKIMSHRMAMGWLLTVLFGGVVFLAYSQPAPQFIAVGMTVWGRTWLALFYFVLLLATVSFQGGFFSRVFCHAWLRYLGKIAFGVYLIHSIVLDFVFDFCAREWGLGSAQSIVVTLVAFGLTVGISAFLYRTIEKPFQRIGHRADY